MDAHIEAMTCLGEVGAFLVRALVPGYSDQDYRFVVGTLAFYMVGEPPTPLSDPAQSARTQSILSALLTKLDLDPGPFGTKPDSR